VGVAAQGSESRQGGEIASAGQVSRQGRGDALAQRDRCGPLDPSGVGRAGQSKADDMVAPDALPGVVRLPVPAERLTAVEDLGEDARGEDG